MNSFKTGQRIQWSYYHHLGSKSKTYRTKYGRFIGLVRHTKKYYGNTMNLQLALVRFDGNKSTSKVPYFELKPESGIFDRIFVKDRWIYRKDKRLIRRNDVPARVLSELEKGKEFSREN